MTDKAKRRHYALYDVFTDQPLTGNPLAVVFDGAGLAPEAMQAIAREFNLSETTFVTEPSNPVHRAAVRIFTPSYEMPFAGHPTVGTAIALAERDDLGTDRILTLEEAIGPVRCAVAGFEGGVFAAFDLPKLPRGLDFTVEPDAIGAALGLGPHEIGFENHRPGLWTAGVAYVTVPVRGLAEAAKASLDLAAWRDLVPADEAGKVASVYIYCRETIGHDNSFHARMFVATPPSFEDPATGSAAAAFAGAVAHFDEPVDGWTTVWIEQGVEMGRASRIRLEIEMDGGSITAARIGGHAVKVAEGVLLV